MIILDRYQCAGEWAAVECRYCAEAHNSSYKSARGVRQLLPHEAGSLIDKILHDTHQLANIFRAGIPALWVDD